MSILQHFAILKEEFAIAAYSYISLMFWSYASSTVSMFSLKTMRVFSSKVKWLNLIEVENVAQFQLHLICSVWIFFFP